MYFPSKPFIFYNPLSLSLSPPCPSRSCCRLSCRSVSWCAPSSLWCAPFHGAPRPVPWCAPFRSMVCSVVFHGVLRCVRRLISRRVPLFVRQPSGLPRLWRGPLALPWFSRSAVALPLCRCFPALPLLSRSSFPFAVFCTPLLSRGLIVSPSPFRPRRSACHNLRAASSQAVPSPRWESARRFARDS